MWGIYWGYIGLMEKKMETTIGSPKVGAGCCSSWRAVLEGAQIVEVRIVNDALGQACPLIRARTSIRGHWVELRHFLVSA